MARTRKNRLVKMKCPRCGENSQHLTRFIRTGLAMTCPHCRRTFELEEVPDQEPEETALLDHET